MSTLPNQVVEAVLRCILHLARPGGEERMASMVHSGLHVELVELMKLLPAQSTLAHEIIIVVAMLTTEVCAPRCAHWVQAHWHAQPCTGW